MSTAKNCKTVLFTDIVGSSKLYQRLGNEAAEAQIRFIIKTLQACAKKHSGKVIKTIGDEIMCCFDSLLDASECASEMNILMLEPKIELRTGISSGELIIRDDDLFGDVVNNAAFLTKAARAREILVDETALDHDIVSTAKKIELVAEMTIKGQDKPCKIYRINWEQAINSSLASTLVNNLSEASVIDQTKVMKLSYLGQELEINHSKPVLVIGRDKTNIGLKINHVKISRKHCTIEFKQGKFVISDHSTNGTFVLQSSNELTSVHRESFALLGKGQLLLGQADAAELCTIAYEIS